MFRHGSEDESEQQSERVLPKSGWDYRGKGTWRLLETAGYCWDCWTEKIACLTLDILNALQWIRVFLRLECLILRRDRRRPLMSLNRLGLM